MSTLEHDIFEAGEYDARLRMKFERADKVFADIGTASDFNHMLVGNRLALYPLWDDQDEDKEVSKIIVPAHLEQKAKSISREGTSFLYCVVVGVGDLTSEAGDASYVDVALGDVVLISHRLVNGSALDYIDWCGKSMIAVCRSTQITAVVRRSKSELV